MSSSCSPPHVIEDCCGILQLFSDGAVVRSSLPLFDMPTLSDPTVAFKDTQFDSTHNLTLRIYKPLNAPGPHPVLVFFHGGGFCIGTYDWPIYHNPLLRLAADLGSIVVAPDYRLAPETRLPAAFEDSESAINWVLAKSNPFLEDADMGRVFIAGESAGANIAHHLAVKYGERGSIRGYVLLQPFFGGLERTESEASCGKDSPFNLELYDRSWRVSLPIGSTRDDPLANPFGPGAPDLAKVEMGNMMVIVSGRDLLRDRGREYGKRLKEMGKRVEVVEIEGEDHGFFTMNPRSAAADEVVRLFKSFIDENGRECSKAIGDVQEGHSNVI